MRNKRPDRRHCHYGPASAGRDHPGTSEVMSSTVAIESSQSIGEEARALINQLVEADEKLDRLLGGEVDAVYDSRGRTILLSRAQAALRQSDDAREAAILNTLPAHVSVLDAEGEIVTVNEPWRHFARHNGLRADDCGVGMNYLEVCDRAAAGGSEEARRTAMGLRDILAGTSRTLTFEYPCHSPSEQRWFLLRASGVDGGGAVVMHIDITEKKKNEYELERLSRATAARERLLSTMLASIPDLAYAADREGRLLYANPPSLALWGISMEQAIGRTVHEIGYPAELAAHVHAQIRQVFETGRTLVSETAFTNRMGEQGCYEYVFAPAWGPDGTVEFMVGCSRDITARKQSEVALQESFAQFRSLAAATPQIVWTANADGEVIYLNEQWLEFTGRTVAEGMRHGWVESVHVEDQGAVLRAYKRAIGAGERFSIEAQMRRRDGTPRWFIIRGVPVRADNRVIKWVGTCTDVDELKTAELQVKIANRELQRQRGELRTLFDLVPAMVWFKDLEGRIVQLNSRAAAMTNLTVDTAVGRTVAELFPENAEAYAAEDREIVRTRQPLLGRIERIK
ncbi:MAG TPA: PAS domain S-box protein, partial [Ramlibacter sp.]